VNTDARKVDPRAFTRTNEGERCRSWALHQALPVVGAAPGLAEGTAGIEPAGEAERAAAAKSEALAPWTQGETRPEVERLPREGKRVHEPLPEAPPRKREREVDKPQPEALPRERECERARTGGKTQTRSRGAGAKGRAQTRHDAARQPKRGRSRAQSAVASTIARGRPIRLGGTRPWGSWTPTQDLEGTSGKSPREHVFESKRPVEAIDTAPGIDAHWHNKRRSGIVARKAKQGKPGRSKYQLGGTITRNQPRTWYSYSTVPSCRRGVHPFLS